MPVTPPAISQGDPFADLAPKDPFADLAPGRHSASDRSGDIDLRQSSTVAPPTKSLLTPLPSNTPLPATTSGAGTLPAFASTPSDQVYQGPPRANSHATKLTGLPRILTQYIAQPMVDNPVQTVATSMLPVLALPQVARMGKDIAQYGGQKAAELSLPPKEQAEAEADPNRIPGERVAVEAGMLGVGALIHGGVDAVRSVGEAAHAPPLWEKEAPGDLFSSEGLALSRADAIAARPDPFADLAPKASDEEAPPAGIKFTDKRAASAMVPEPKILTPSEASATPGKIITPEAPALAGKIVAPTPEAQPSPGPLVDRFGTPPTGPASTPTGTYDAIGIGRRPLAELPMEQRPPAEPRPDAETQSFGGRVVRRPGGDVALPESPATQEVPPAVLARINPESAPIEPPADAQTVSASGREPSTIQPLVSANGMFEARPGVLRKVNADLGPEPTQAGTTPTAASLAEQPDVAGTRSFVAKEVTPGQPTLSTPGPRPSDILNVAKLNLDDATAQQGVEERLEQFRSMRDEQKQTFAESDVNRKAILNELTANNPKALAPAAAAKLSGEELLARRDVVNQNDHLIGELSKSMESGQLSPEQHDAAAHLVQKAIEHNDALLSDLVTGSSQKGRDLNLLRRMANTSLDPAVWMVQAKRMLGDAPMTDEMMSDIRKLVRTAAEACGG